MENIKVDIQLLKKLRDKTDLSIGDCKEALIEKKNNFKEALDLLKIKGLAKSEKKNINKAEEGITSVFIDNNNAIIGELNCQTQQVANLKEFKNLFNEILIIILKNKPKNIEKALKIKYNKNNDDLNNKIKLAIAKLDENIILKRFHYLIKTSDEVFGSYIHGGGKYSSLVIVKGDENKEINNIANNIAMQLVSGDAQYIDINQIPKEIYNKELSIITQKTNEEKKLKGEKRSNDIIKNIIKKRLNKKLFELTILNQNYIKDNTIKVKDYLKKYNVIIKKMIRYQLGE